MRMSRSILALAALAAFVVAPAHALTLKIATISPDGTAWMKELRAAGAEIEDIHVEPPRLEEVFTRLTGRELRE